eukprot:Phypoly_transcript_17876.p1 GENE.Phypoly_transcript_17876~~Phypoly_transcript_17876.p1  ORF type:complete len:164 (+),score=25.47 Phypoly_transcript_17876:254-745(+)
MATYAGQCYCGAVKFEVHGEPKLPHLCTCHDCRHAHATEASHQVVYDETNFKVTHGQDHVQGYEHPGAKSNRHFCKKCGTRTHRSIPGLKAVVVFPSNFDVCNGGANKCAGGELPAAWKPQSHLFYGSRYKGHEYEDGLTFQNDMPKELGGSGKALDFKGNAL